MERESIGLSSSFQLFVFLPRLDQNRDILIGIFPEGKEVLISLACFCGVASKYRRARQAHVSERIQRGVNHKVSVIDYFLEFSQRLRTILTAQIGNSAGVCR